MVQMYKTFIIKKLNKTNFILFSQLPESFNKAKFLFEVLKNNNFSIVS